MATLRHANLCPVFDVGEIAGVHYLTMAFIDGHPLTDYLKKGKPLPSRRVAAVIRKLAIALDIAHKAGIVHRDLKPANIMIDEHKEPIIMDFGLARRQIEGEAELTHSGAILGTPAFMSPEQVEGRQDKIGPVTDVYALGVILYQMICGQLPFSGTVGSVMAKILTEEPRTPHEVNSDVDLGLQAVCQKAISKAIDGRYASAQELAADLAKVLKGKRPDASPAQEVAEEELELMIEGTAPSPSATSFSVTGQSADRLAVELFEELTPVAPPVLPSPTVANVSTSLLTVTPPPPGPDSRHLGAPSQVASRPPLWVWIAAGSGLAVLLLLLAALGIVVLSKDTSQSTQPQKRQEGQREPDGEDHGSGSTPSQQATPSTVPSVAATDMAKRKLELKQISLGMHNYHDVFGAFPPSRNLGRDQRDASGEPKLSWRVHILPFIELRTLYDQFNLDEPWDSPHNIKLLDKMPAAFQSIASTSDTTVLRPMGNGAAYDGKTGPRLASILDGTQDTIMVIEAGPDKALPWTKPDDVTFDPQDPLSLLGQLERANFLAAFYDGSVREVPTTIAPETLRALITASGGETVTTDF